MNKRNWLRLLLVGAVCVGAAAALWTLFPKLSSDTLQLADGRQVTVKGATFGTQHRYVAGKPWAKALAPIVPVKWRQRLGVTVLERKVNSPVLMVWVEWRHLAPDRLSATDATVSDGHGFETEPKRPAVMGVPEPFVTVQGWDFANFPRRSETLELKLYLWSGAGQPGLQARFTLPNPVRRGSDSWVAPALPVTVTNGGTEFGLLRFVTGQRIPDRLKPARGWIAPWTTAEFRVTQQGEPAGLWKVENILATDATGNAVISTATASLTTGVEPAFGFNGVLWPQEPAWKLEVEFSRLTDFTAEELWSLPSIPVPALRSQTLINRETVIQGVKVVAQSLGRSPGSFAGFRATSAITLIVLPCEKVRLRLIRAIDDRGREIRHAEGYSTSRAGYVFWLDLPEDSSSVDFTFALRKSRFIEFLARPELAESRR